MNSKQVNISKQVNQMNSIDSHSDKANRKIGEFYVGISSFSRLHNIYFEDRMF